ncbi:SdiA-regulated domain-containing protein [Hymenobacter cellulosivorans]|uniref:SdiA-regulated domain-containing protein n=1 Tax=Hymenobacter cellulosivorans TaxID=2932249 RepID=A0ABY4FE53_9BACT|nr:SdiA-regulated domain-containing protein [Hymenobacter cellulosivorans]UOQ54874.1 SdiA-regulated domain-containing protein [Hymenobacter cellulosivorans]
MKPVTLSLAGALTAVFLTGSPVLAQSAAQAYDWQQPTATYSLPKELQEVSGIALLSGQRLGCIEDQTGTIYIYNLASKSVESTLKFGKKGDYEDLARLPGAWLVLRSDGTLFKYKDDGTTSSYPTGLTAANNPEGLAYDASSKTLLIACKGAAGVGQPDQRRAIYRLDAKTYQAQTKPAFVLDVAEIIALDRRQSPGSAINRFAPSAVAVHPLTRHIFVLAASGNALVEMDAQGTPLAVQKLPRKLFPQPEGLTFAPNGDLYISSEMGDNGKAGTIQFFRASPIAANK